VRAGVTASAAEGIAKVAGDAATKPELHAHLMSNPRALLCLEGLVVDQRGVNYASPHALKAITHLSDSIGGHLLLLNQAGLTVFICKMKYTIIQYNMIYGNMIQRIIMKY
jgi:hypothetical protein